MHSRKTPCAPSARARKMSEPVRIPESNSNVSFPLACASLTFCDFLILSSATKDDIDPSI